MVAGTCPGRLPHRPVPPRVRLRRRWPRPPRPGPRDHPEQRRTDGTVARVRRGGRHRLLGRARHPGGDREARQPHHRLGLPAGSLHPGHEVRAPEPRLGDRGPAALAQPAEPGRQCHRLFDPSFPHQQSGRGLRSLRPGHLGPDCRRELVAATTRPGHVGVHRPGGLRHLGVDVLVPASGLDPHHRLQRHRLVASGHARLAGVALGRVRPRSRSHTGRLCPAPATQNQCWRGTADGRRAGGHRRGSRPHPGGGGTGRRTRGGRPSTGVTPPPWCRAIGAAPRPGHGSADS
jgi:hypothetical protein